MKTEDSKTKNKWSIDQAHSEIGFRVRHLMISHVRGSFKVFDASIYTSGQDFTTAEIDLWIDASSINTGNTQRDTHLQSSDFFDVANHKQITFTSTTIGKPDADGNRELWGELTMRGVSKNVKLNLELGGIVMDPYGNEKAGLTVTGKINRNDWELSWNSPMENGGFLVSEDVTISCEIELTNIGVVDQVMILDTAASE